MTKAFDDLTAWYIADTFGEAPCDTCTHYRGNGKCEAFPDQIPLEILSLEHDHKTPFLGDKGIMYEARA